MNRHEIHIRICDVKRRTHDVYVLLSFACLTFFPRTVVMMAYPEVFILEVGIECFENVHIKTIPVLETSWYKINR